MCGRICGAANRYHPVSPLVVSITGRKWLTTTCAAPYIGLFAGPFLGAALVSLTGLSGAFYVQAAALFATAPAMALMQQRGIPLGISLFGIVSAAGYLTAWIFYSKHDDRIGLPNIVYTHFGFLLWLAVATTALCFVLARRSVRVKALQEVRRQLVSEAMQADERRNRR